LRGLGFSTTALFETAGSTLLLNIDGPTDSDELETLDPLDLLLLALELLPDALDVLAVFWLIPVLPDAEMPGPPHNESPASLWVQAPSAR